MNTGIIVTSFGTTYENTRKLCIESIENRIRDEFKESLVIRAFTSRIVINKLKKRDDYYVNNPTEALEEMKKKGIKKIYIQPLLIIEGIEYEKILREVNDFIEENNRYEISIGKPLLSSKLDYIKVIKALELDKEKNPVVFMGHGSDHKVDISYNRIEEIMKEKSYDNIFVGTIEGGRNLEHILVELKEKSIDKVHLRPFMLVAGDHIINDMASDDDSWKSILKQNGIESDATIEGLGQIKEIQDIFIEHLKEIKDEKNVY